MFKDVLDRRWRCEKYEIIDEAFLWIEEPGIIAR